jgi:hypothetical protein
VHQAADSFSIDRMTFPLQFFGHLPRAIKGSLQILAVNQLHQGQFQFRDAHRLIIKTGTVNTGQFTLALDKKPFEFAIDSLAPLF